MSLSKIKKSLDTLSYYSLIMYILDIILLGTGMLTKYGFFSSRILFFSVAILAALPDMWEKRRDLLKNKLLWMVGIFLIYIFIMGIYGYFAGNKVSVIIQDLKGFLNFAILPVMMVKLNSKEKINHLLKFVFVGCLAIAGVSFILSFAKFFPNNLTAYLVEKLKHYGLVQLTFLTDKATRVVFDTTSRYMFVAFVIGIYFTASKVKANKLAIVAMGCIMASIYISYIRGVYLGAVVAGIVAIIIMIFTSRSYLKHAFKCLGLATVICLIIVSSLSFMQKENLFVVGFLRSTSGLKIDTSDLNVDEEINKEQEEYNFNLREYRLTEINKGIKKSPIIGNGLGYTIDENTDYIEYFYQDLWAKTGIIGVILLCAPLFALLSVFLKKRRKIGEHTLMLQGLMYCCALYVFVISYFNPCMNSTIGISVFTLSIAIVSPINAWDQKLVLTEKSE